MWCKMVTLCTSDLMYSINNLNFKEMKRFNSIIYSAVAILIALIMFGTVKYRYTVSDKISVTGLGEKEFVSDLIVWRGTLNVESKSLIDGYKVLENQQTIVKKYLAEQGVLEDQIVFMFVNSFKTEKPTYSNGNYIGSDFLGYQLTQDIKIESNDVDKIEAISRNISILISKGINIYSQQPEYYYTKLEELKLEIIEAATSDALVRAEKIASKAGASLGNLMSGKMGIFQIVGKNSNEDFSWGGAYNTSSKNKKATITMRLDYHIK